jgi:hypothetical protein
MAHYRTGEIMEPTLADLLAQQSQTGWSGDQMIGGAAGGAMSPGQAMLGMQAMKNIQGALPQQEPLVMPGGAGIAPRGQQVQMAKQEPAAPGIDPRVQLGLAQLLFGGR